MNKILKVILGAAAVALGAFVLSFTVYFFNLDMKLMAAVEPLLDKIYDKRKRQRKV